MEILHIHGQQIWHDYAFIVGTPKALQDLRDAIDVALNNNVAKCDAFVCDGEGYSIIVQCMPEEKCAELGVPYIDEVASEKDTEATFPWKIDSLVDFINSKA